MILAHLLGYRIAAIEAVPWAWALVDAVAISEVQKHIRVGSSHHLRKDAFGGQP